MLDVGDFLGLHTGDNPHRWYFPDDVARVIDRITADHQSIDPANASYYAQQHDSFTGRRCVRITTSLRRSVDARLGHAGGRVGEHRRGLGRSDRARPGDADARSSTRSARATIPSAPDKVTVDSQIANHQISVFIYNSQNATPDVQRLVNEAQANNIPVVTVTETPVPAGVTFQDWQTAQLQQLADALAERAGDDERATDAIDVHEGAISLGGRIVWTRPRRARPGR